MTRAPHPTPPRLQPAEWEPHAACWVAWPSHRELWGDQLEATRAAFARLCHAIADPDPEGAPRGERLDVLVPDAGNEALARAALSALGARFHRVPFGDIWLRDTAPIFVREGGTLRAARFGFNGWGRKHLLPGDSEVATRIAALSGLPEDVFEPVLEGGAVEADGAGTLLTTRQCLLNPNRNPGLDRTAVEALLERSLGARAVIWLGDGLRNDHTDGHVDTLARFVARGRVVCMSPSGSDDPNHDVLEAVADDLRAARDADARCLDVESLPSPGPILDPEGRLMPASYVNFYLANTTVSVPQYGCAGDAEALSRIAGLFPTRRAVGIEARALLTGGGAFHCITQQQPASTGGHP